MDKIKLGQWLLRNSTTFPPKPNHCELAMNANEAELPFTREMPFEAFFPIFVQTYLTREKLEPCIATLQAPVSHEMLLEFFQSETVRRVFKHTWDFERDTTRFRNRAMDIVMEETVGHTLSKIAGFLTMQADGEQTIFQDHPIPVGDMHNIVYFCMAYFNQVFHKNSPLRRTRKKQFRDIVQ